MQRQDIPWRRWRRAIVATVLWLAVGGGCFACLRAIKRSMDLSIRPPAEVFELVFRRPPPSGVTGVEAAGYLMPTAGQVWMRFRATNTAMEELLTDKAH